MDSLYGGKPGISFVLKASFKSRQEMYDAFAKGGNYTAVWYGEYVIIDTINKQDIHNGEIYRRGLDYQAKNSEGITTGGAEYIGRIVGPSSGTPYFEINNLNTVKERAGDEVNNETSWKRYPTGKDSNDRYIISENGNGKDIGTFDFNTQNALVPGKIKGKDEWNDSIKYTWVNIRNDEEDADSWFYVGFQIPFTIIDFITHTVNPYDSLGNRIDRSEVKRNDDESHPFWEEWDIGVPKGIKGDAITNLKIIVPTKDDEIYKWSAISTTKDEKGNYITKVGEPGYTDLKEGIDQQDDIDNKRKILVYNYTYYDSQEKGETIMVYVGDYEIIESIELDEYGTLKLNMSHRDQYHFDKKIRWIKYIELTDKNGAEGGHFRFTWNNDDPTETTEFDVRWIKGIEVEENGSLTYTYVGKHEPSELTTIGNQSYPTDLLYNDKGEQRTVSRISEGVYRVHDFLQWIGDIGLNVENGHFTITNNRQETIFQADLDWIKDITLSSEGVVTLWHTATGSEVLDQKIKWVNSVSLDYSSGLFTMRFNYGEDLVVQMDWISDLYIDESTGEIAIHHVDDSQNVYEGTSIPSKASNGQSAEILAAKLKLITKAQLSSDGILTFITNTGDSYQVTTGNSDQPFKVQKIDDIKLASINDKSTYPSVSSYLTADKHIKVKYNTENAYQNIGDPINYIQDMVVRTRDWHLLVLYNDPEHRHVVERDGSLNEKGEGKYGYKWVNDIEGSDGETYSSAIYWRDYGPIKDQSGILIGFNITEEQVQNASNRKVNNGEDPYKTILDYLNDPDNPDGDFTNGLTGDQNYLGGASSEGKIVTYSPADSDDVEFYAFDYRLYEWYLLGTLSDSGMRDARLYDEVGSSPTEKAEIISTITVDGLLFTARNMTSTSDEIPDYWCKDGKKFVS